MNAEDEKKRIIDFYNKTILNYNNILNILTNNLTIINSVLITDYEGFSDDKGNIVDTDKIKKDVVKDKIYVEEQINTYTDDIKYIETLRYGLDSLFNLEGNTDEDKLVAVRHFDNINIKLFGDNYKTDEHTGGSRNKPNYDTMTMTDIKKLCKANQIKLSRVVNDKRVVYKKKELITKLKRKKVI